MRTLRALLRSQLYKLERELQRERDRLARTLAAEAGATVVSPLAQPSAGSLPGHETAGDSSASLRRRVRGRYDAVVAALARLTDGTYGRCRDCSDPIPFKRLIVMPEVEHCMACGERA